MDYKKTAFDIISMVGGEGNIVFVQHCATRLRLVLKNFELVEDLKIQNLDGIQGTNTSNGQYQIILGPGAVNMVTDEVNKKLGFDENSKINNLEKEEGNFLQRGVKTLSDIFVPIIPAIVAGGLMMGIYNVLTSNFFNGGNDSIISLFPIIAGLAEMINLFSSAAFTFLPVLIGFSAAKKFGGNPFLGAAMGMIMVHPNLLSAYNLGSTPLADVPVWNIFSFNIPAVGYQGTVLPVLVISWILAKLEVKLHKITPIWLDNLTTPLIATLLTGFITFVIVGPVMRTAGDLLTEGINWIYNTLGFVGGAIFGFAYAPITMTGMHHSFIPVETQLIANASPSAGGSFIFPTASMNNVAQGAAVLAVFLITKNEKMKSTAAASGISALLGITEPAMFGITLRLRYPFIAALIGSAAGAAWLALRNVLAIALGAAGLPGFISIRPENWLDFGIGIIISMGLSFALTIFFEKSNMFMAKENKNEINDQEKNIAAEDKEEIKLNDTVKELEIFSPMKGHVEAIEKSNDPTFASKALGDGLAISPSENKIYAPQNCRVETVFPTKHALALSLDGGIKMLIHCGIDTVSLNGQGFTSYVEDGDLVKKGTLLLEYDPKTIKDKGFSDQTMVILMELDDNVDISIDSGQKLVGEKVINLKL